MSYHDGHEPDPAASFFVEPAPARYRDLLQLLALAATLSVLATLLL